MNSSINLKGIVVASLLVGALPAGAETTVSFSFSDTLGTQRKLHEMLARHGMRVTFFVNSPRIGRGDYLSLQDLRDFEAAGNEIGGHTLSHDDLSNMDRSDAIREVCDDRVNLLNMGFKVTSFGYPKSGDSRELWEITEGCNYNSGRTTGSLDDASAETIPPQNPFRIRLPSSIRNDDDLDYLQDLVTEAESVENGWIMISFHGICDGDEEDECDGNYEVTEGLLEAFLGWLAPRAAQGTVVKTVHEVMGGEVKPGISSDDFPNR
jgi:peptidoglycan/xylan/chitin deacetylase (PgdA/CDA1 family)